MKAAPLPGAAFVLYWGWSEGAFLPAWGAADGGLCSLACRVCGNTVSLRYRLDFLKTANGWKVVRIATL